MRIIQLFIFFFILNNAGFSQEFEVVHLQCEWLKNPIGIEEDHPMMSWQIKASKRNVSQSAYRILVSDDSLALDRGEGNMWDSEKTVAHGGSRVRYAGRKPEAAKKYFWKVMIWDQQNTASAYSDINSWQMGLPESEDWQAARWIGYDVLAEDSIFIPLAHGNGKKEWGKRLDVIPLFRKEVMVEKPVKRATAFVSGLGHYEMSINGRKVGDHFLAPGWTQYRDQAQYESHDITAFISEGMNTVGAIVGNGFYYIPGERYRKMTGAYGYPKLIGLIRIEYADGTVENIVTDESWKTSPSPITFSSIYGGEDYDATLEQSGWDENGFDASSWNNARETTGPALVTEKGEPVKVMKTFVPVQKTKIKPGEWVFDLGQNFSGIPAIELSGKRGDTVRIYPAELLSDDGSVTQKFTGRPHYYTYILKGEDREIWQPRFSYYGFRYLQVSGAEPEEGAGRYPVIHHVEGKHIRNSASSAGTFSCSNELFNQIHELILWAINSNMVSVFTDCPHREKLGWQEQVHLMGNAIRFNYDIQSFADKIMRDIRTQQTPEGLVPSTIPEFTEMYFADGYFRDSPEWGSSAIIFPWYVYHWSGDKKILEENYPTMKKYFGYLQSKDSAHTLNHGLSDWYDLGPERPGFSQLTPMGLTATAYYYYDAFLLSKIAGLLGETEDFGSYAQEALKIKEAFNSRFFDPQGRYYGNNSQASNAIALYMGLVKEENREAVLQNLIQDIRSKNNSFTTGDIGHRYLLKVLEEAGRSDVIWDMHSRDEVPGYGYQIRQGATALTESWQALPTVSNNHFMLGHLMEWFYSGLGGINQEEGSTGYQNIELKPQPCGEIDEVRVTYCSVNGPIKVHWRIEEDTFTLDADIPPNATATMIFPEDFPRRSVRVSSGSYQFVSKRK